MGKTVAEKIFDTHLVDTPSEGMHVIRLDAVFCHEITTPPAVVDLEVRGKDRVFDSDKVKVVIDHVTPAKDSKTALQGKILRDWARRNDIKDFFDIGRNGVCHALFPEKGFVRPGYTVIMGDSHTCTHGAFGAFAAGVGTTDLEVGLLKGVCAFRYPNTIKIDITGQLAEGVYSKDVILALIGKLGVNGATDKVVEFTGPVVSAMSMEARMTLCNMAVEAGATSGICYPDMVTVDYLWPFIENAYADKEAALAAFQAWLPDADATYDDVMEFNVSDLTPQVTYGYKPDCVKPLKEMEAGLHRLLHQRAHRGPADRRRHPQGEPHQRYDPGDRFPCHAGHLSAGPGRGDHQDLHGCGILCHQPHLRCLSRHEQRGIVRGRGGRLHHQPEFQRPDGQGRHGAPDESRKCRGFGADREDHQLTALYGLMIDQISMTSDK